MILKLTAIVTTLFILGVRNGEGLKCSDVIADRKPREVDCEGSCASSKTLIDGDSTYAATCVPMKLKDMCTEVDGSDVCYCNSDLCNAPKPKPKPVSEMFSDGGVVSELFTSAATHTSALYTVTWLLFIAVVMVTACIR